MISICCQASHSIEMASFFSSSLNSGSPVKREELWVWIDKIKTVSIMTIYSKYSPRRFTMLIIQDYIPVTKAKASFLDIIRKIEGSEDAIAITKNGVPEAILLSMKKFEGLLETLEILSDEKAMKSIRKSIKEAQQGKWLDHDEVFGE